MSIAYADSYFTKYEHEFYVGGDRVLKAYVGNELVYPHQDHYNPSSFAIWTMVPPQNCNIFGKTEVWQLGAIVDQIGEILYFDDNAIIDRVAVYIEPNSKLYDGITCDQITWGFNGEKQDSVSIYAFGGRWSKIVYKSKISSLKPMYKDPGYYEVPAIFFGNIFGYDNSGKKKRIEFYDVGVESNNNVKIFYDKSGFISFLAND